MELLKVDTLEETLEKLYYRYNEPLETEDIFLTKAFGRVLAEDVVCHENIPAFNRSTMDGYAVKAKDTMGSGESMPTFLEVVGEVEMGKAPGFGIKSGQCAYVPTGGMVPQGADSVVMVEHCQPFGINQVAVYDAMSHGRNMVFAGDDVAEGQVVLKSGRKIRPADMGLLASMGRMTIKAYKPWKVYVISTGDEIINPGGKLNYGQMRDVNTYGLMGEIESLGLELAGFELIKDEYELLMDSAKRASKISDIVLISGGSSKGKKDVTAKVIDEITDKGVLVHGIAVKPGKPTILGAGMDNLFVGLPGHPVAALLLFRLVVGGLWKHMTGMDCEEKTFTKKAKMAINLAASPGRKTFQLVKLEEDEAVPILGKSGLIKTMSDADGYIVLDVNDEGINRGEVVEVHLL